MELQQHHNYVFVYADGRFKIGRTRDPARRMRELKPDLYDVGRPVSARVALLTETHVRRTLRHHALPGTLEWFRAPKNEAAAVAGLTAHTQVMLEAAGA